MPKKGGNKNVVNTTTTTSLDPASQGFITGTLRPAGRDLANLLANQPAIPGVDPATQAAIAQASPQFALGQTQLDPFVAQQIGQLGSLSGTIGQALSGGIGSGTFGGGGGGGAGGFNLQAFDPDRIRDFFNPFEQEVVSAQEGSFDRQRDIARSQAQQQAIRQGVFGGDRAALFESEALGGVNRQEAETLAALRHQGFAGARDAAIQEFLGRNQIRGNVAAAGISAAGAANAAGIAASQRAASDRLNAILQAGQFDIGTDLERQRLNQGAHAQGYGLNLQNLGQGIDAQLGLGALNLNRIGTLGSLGESRRNTLLQQGQLPLQNFIAGIPAIAGALGPTGSTINQRSVERSGGSSVLGQILGTGLTLAGGFFGGPPGAAAGGAIGSSLFGGGGGGGSPLSIGSGLPVGSVFNPASVAF